MRHSDRPDTPRSAAVTSPGHGVTRTTESDSELPRNRGVTTDAGALVILPGLVIPPGELSWRFSRGGGPGGQNVNKVETRVELLFRPSESRTLTPDQKQILLDRLGHRLDARGDLHITAGESRTQIQNRQAACDRLAAVLREALRPRRSRRQTRVPSREKQARLEAKRMRSHVKRMRRLPSGDSAGHD